MRLPGFALVPPVLPQHPDLEDDLPDLLQRLAAKEPQGFQQIEDCRPCAAHETRARARQSPEAHSWPGLQLLGRRHIQHRLEVLLGVLDVALGEGQAVDGLRVPGIGLEGAAQAVESPQAALLLAEDRAQAL